MASVSVSQNELKALEDCLLNVSGKVPLHVRFRALFTLKGLKSDEAVAIIGKGFADDSALLKHELAYCLGQSKKTSALPTLEAVLRNKSEDPMVRHEAAEAMGAISSASSIPVLEEFLSDSEDAVRETCEIAIAKIKWDNSEEGKKHQEEQKEGVPLYTSIDPAPPTSGLLKGAPKPEDVQQSSIEQLQAQLVDTKLPLFERYRAMFALRNIGTPAAVDALASGFSDKSALFKHEIAFIFGQLLSPHSVPALLEVLQDKSESDMVRHEAAEALGGIATPEVLPHLREWMTRDDSPQVVRESCQVAIDMWEYENSGEFQYANALETVAGAGVPRDLLGGPIVTGSYKTEHLPSSPVDLPSSTTMKNAAQIAHGPMLIGFTLNAILYGIMITQVYLYYTTYKRDPLFLRLLVLFLLIADTVNTVFDFLYLYNSLILKFGDMVSIQTADWLFATDPAITGIIATAVQLFFAWRIRVLTRSWFFVGVVGILALAGMVGSIVTAWEVGRTPNFVDFRNFKSVVIIWLASESLGDILITAILVTFLCVHLFEKHPAMISNSTDPRSKRHKTGFKNSDQIVDRVIRVSVQTGLLTSIVAILDLIFFLADVGLGRSDT
ncbi:hypothetical protein NMY22_g5417 [Coprinellus aureogranulatus]|nr:hypothetical protein NMY22_g5417 [Coprinellus aureogranulatus]